MTNKKKIKARAMSKKTGMSYAESVNALNKNVSKIEDGYNKIVNPDQDDLSSANQSLEVLYSALGMNYKDVIKAERYEDIKNEIFIKQKIANILECVKNSSSIQSVLLEDSCLIDALMKTKVLIDRWNLLTNNFILHTKHKESIDKLVHFGMAAYNNSKYGIWGTDIFFTNDIDENMIIALDNVFYNNTFINLAQELEHGISFCRFVTGHQIKSLDADVSAIKNLKSNVCITHNIINKIVDYKELEIGAENEVRYAKIGEQKIYVSDYAKEIEILDDGFTVIEFENNKINQHPIIKKINAILEDSNNAAVCMNFNDFSDLLNVSKRGYSTFNSPFPNIIDPVTQREILQSGLYAYYKYNTESKNIYVSRYCEPGILIGLPHDVVGKMQDYKLAPKVFLDYFQELEKKNGNYSDKFKEYFSGYHQRLEILRARELKLLGFTILSEEFPDKNIGKISAKKLQDGTEILHEFEYPLFPE